ncbi:MAG: hypothetical protein MZV70_16535 [Desulfobacterales bacterium]|nr:hypothetical protein [Desulfobacterales bacterium]
MPLSSIKSAFRKSSFKMKKSSSDEFYQILEDENSGRKSGRKTWSENSLTGNRSHASGDDRLATIAKDIAAHFPQSRAFWGKAWSFP